MDASSGTRSPLHKVASVTSTLFLVASPWVLYLTLSRDRLDLAALALVGWGALRAVPVVLTAAPAQRNAALQLPVIALVVAFVGWVRGDEAWLLVLPSVTQAAFAMVFLRSLRTTPLIEHFARMVKPQLGPVELAHCRRWTRIWGCYLLVLAAIGLGLARWATLTTWTVYVGILNYVLVGGLFVLEYLLRKIQFRDYGPNPVDRLLSRLFPATGDEVR